MIKVKKDELNKFLESRKERFERPIMSGVGEIVSGVSLFVTLLTSQFDEDLLIPPEYLEMAFWLIGVALIAVGIYSLITGIRQRQTVKNLYSSICELDIKRVHVVHIVLVHQPDSGKYLLFQNDAWKCAIFPSYNAITVPYDMKQEMERIRNSFSCDTGIEVRKVTYLNSMEDHIKPCAGNDLPYRYRFHFFGVEMDSSVEDLKTYNGRKYVWKTLDEMRKNKNIMAKNEDVVNHVAELESIPYN